MKKNEKKYEFPPPEGQEINWSPRGALLINVFFGWELLGILTSRAGFSVGGCQKMHKKIKDVPERTPEKMQILTLFSPSRDPPGGRKKCIFFIFFHFFSTFLTFPDFSIEDSRCRIPDPRIRRKDVPW